MDLYFVLGLAPDATAADIKRAYRRLARRYHPGINPGDRAAEAMFRQISEAYETLIDPARRQRYDAAGPGDAEGRPESVSLEFTEFDFSARAHGPHAATFTELFADVLHPIPPADATRPRTGADLHASLTIPFVEAVRGAERQVVVTRQVSCGNCHGAGRVAIVEARCPVCHGAGRLRWARGHMVFSKPCTGCSGSGRQRYERCIACGGYGAAVRTDAVAVAIPPGTADGVRIRLPGIGHAGGQGGRPGDLYVTVHVKPHPFFRREGDDLICVVPVAIHEAAFGGRIEVPSLDGGVKVRIPPGTQSGHRIRVSGRGVPRAAGGRGDLVVEVRLVLPSDLDEHSKELLRLFAERNHEDVRRDVWAAARQ